MKFFKILIAAVAFTIGFVTFAGDGLTKYVGYATDTTTAVYTVPYDYSVVAVRPDSLDGTLLMYWEIGTSPDSLYPVKADTGVVHTTWPDSVGGFRSLPLIDFHYAPYIRGVFGIYGSAVAQDSATQVNSPFRFIISIL